RRSGGAGCSPGRAPPARPRPARWPGARAPSPAAGAGAPPSAGRGSSPLAGLLMWGVPAAPAAVLAQLDAIRRIAPRLVRFVVAALALLASEGHANSNV